MDMTGATTGATETTALVKDEKGNASVCSSKKEASSGGGTSSYWIVVIAASAIMGLLFGVAFYKSHVYEPQTIRGQFLFRRFIMLKVFFGAMGIGALIFSAMSYLGMEAFGKVRHLWKHTSMSRSWLTGAALGGTLLGIGMAVSGACPGMVWTALGAGTANSAVTILGGLAGALTYGLFAEKIQSGILMKGPAGPCADVYADEALGMSSASGMTAFLGLVCLVGCAALEALVPWKSEVPVRLEGAMSDPSCLFGTASFSFVQCPAWPPSVAGLLIGALQLPAILLIGNVLGSSTAFQICACVWMLPLSAEKRARYGYMNAFATPNPKSWWQLPYVAFAAVGACLCAGAANDDGGAAGVGNVAALVGGFLIIFGSRLGGGCTSGHGLSGCAMLMVQSWIAVPAMFAGGILVAVAWQSVGAFFQPN